MDMWANETATVLMQSSFFHADGSGSFLKSIEKNSCCVRLLDQVNIPY